MNRRQFLLTSAGIGLGTGLAGCTDTNPRPPRRSAIVSDITLQDGSLVVDLRDNPSVTTREERIEGNVGTALLPVGVASAKKGGSGGKRGSSARSRSTRTRGSRSSYRSAHKSRTGFAYYYWSDDHDDWYEEHEDELQQVEPQLNSVGVAAVPNLEDKELGAETVAWDKIKQDVSKGDTLRLDTSDNSEWYRVGVDLERFSTDLGWEFYDVEVSNGEVNQIWKVPQQL